MFQLFSQVYPHIRFRDHQIKKPSNYVFQLHYRITFGILLVCIILVSSYEYIDSSGSAIQCFMDRGVDIPENVINRYCWIQSTFTLPTSYDPALILRNNPGVGAIFDENSTQYHAYYQWVPLFLSMQAIFFYFPHWLWKVMEGGRLKSLVAQLKEKKEENDKEALQECFSRISEYFAVHMKEQWEHRIWALKYLFCETLNLFNVIFQMSLTNTFLRGEFKGYGGKVLDYIFQDPEYRDDPMSKVFPKVTKCTFKKYGGSGTLQKLDAFCVLGMNIINEKVFVFLWFWFWILLILNIINLGMRVIYYFYPQTRYTRPDTTDLKHWKMKPKFMGNMDVVKRMTFSDWIVFAEMSRDIDKQDINIILDGIAREYLPSYSMEMSERQNETDTLKLK